MRIEKDQIVAGLPAQDVRRFLRSTAGVAILPTTVTRILGLSRRKAHQFLAELEEVGLVTSVAEYWEATAMGYALGMATAAKPLRRETAEQLLVQIVERADFINQNESLAYRVHRLVLFGSVLKGVDRPNDVDIGCELRPRLLGERQRLLEEQRRAIKGTFANTSEWASWPKIEVMKLLKSRSRGLSVQDTSGWALGELDHRVVFNDLPHPKVGCGAVRAHGRQV
jgi:hypothetical protein